MARKSGTPSPPRPVKAPKRRDTRSRRRHRRSCPRATRWWLEDDGPLGTASWTTDRKPALEQRIADPPWPGRTIGLSQLTAEGEVQHTHQHLDLYVHGKHVPVPQGIGIYDNAWLTDLHTHDATGVIHLESPKTGDFTLGQFFGAWGVKLTRACVGTRCGGVSWWVDGKKQSGDPASLDLRAHQEIVVAEGRPPSRMPRSYNFPYGL